MSTKTPLTAPEMFDELMRYGAFTTANTDPAAWMEPTAYVSVPTSLTFVTPPIIAEASREGKDAKLGARPKRNTKGKGRARRR